MDRPESASRYHPSPAKLTSLSNTTLVRHTADGNTQSGTA